MYGANHTDTTYSQWICMTIYCPAHLSHMGGLKHVLYIYVLIASCSVISFDEGRRAETRLV